MVGLLIAVTVDRSGAIVHRFPDSAASAGAAGLGNRLNELADTFPAMA